MSKSRLPRWIWIIRYYLNCLWYYVLFPLGAEETEFQKQWKDKKKQHFVFERISKIGY